MTIESSPRWFVIVVSVLFSLGAEICFAQTNLDELRRHNAIQKKEFELTVERARIRSIEADAELARMRAETDRIEASTERMRAASERINAEIEARAAEDRAREAAARQEAITAAAAEKHQEEIDDLRDEIARASVKTKNNLYLVGFVAALAGFGLVVAKIGRKGVPMKENEKVGLVIVIVSIVLTLLSLIISDGWAYNLDILSNLMMTLKIQLFADHPYPPRDFLVDFPTKYMVFGCFCFAAYGVTTYLGITPVPYKRGRK